MIALVLFGIFYVLVPYASYQLVFRLTGSSTWSWIAAVISVPAVILIYVRLFEAVKTR
jgi:hypothetical protein